MFCSSILPPLLPSLRKHRGRPRSNMSGTNRKLQLDESKEGVVTKDLGSAEDKTHQEGSTQELKEALHPETVDQGTRADSVSSPQQLQDSTSGQQDPEQPDGNQLKSCALLDEQGRIVLNISYSKNDYPCRDDQKAIYKRVLQYTG